MKESAALRAAETPAPPPRQRHTRPARALIGWLAPDAAHNLLVSITGGDVGAEIAARARSARECAAARKPVDQANLVRTPPTGIGDHLAALRQHGQQIFDEGFRVCTVSLSQLFAIQPTIFTDYHDTAVESVEPTDTCGLAEITLPLAREAQLSVVGDVTQRSVTLTSPDLNLQLVGPVPPQMGPAGCILGFNSIVANSLLQVAHHEGRYFCRDGHTRALQLLKRGITTVPAIVKEFKSYAEVAPRPNLLPEAVTMGSNPPTLQDFLDERVSADVQLPMTRKAIIVSAIEIELPV